MICLDQDIPLSSHMRHLFLLQHISLTQDLHGIYMARVFLLDEPHFAKRAPSYHLQRVEVLYAQSGSL